MSGDQLHLMTEEQRDRLYRARWSGGTCAACGRDLDAGEAVYMERFADVHRTRTNRVTAPVGVECASAELRLAMADRDPEPCAGCGRPVYYRVENTRRRQALCSRACRWPASKRPKAED